jgi:hypothetical protein
VGLEKIPCVVLPSDFPHTKVRLLRLALNKLRGQTSSTRAAEVLRAVWEEDSALDMSLSGYDADTVKLLVTSLDTPSVDDLLNKLGEPQAAPESSGKRYTLELHFASKEDMKAARGALREAGGANLGLGLLRLAGLLESES